MKHLLLALAVATLSVSSIAQCFDGRLQVKAGNGSDTKIGFTNCAASGCEKKVYRMYSDDEVLTTEYTEAVRDDLDVHYHIVDAYGSSISFVTKFDPVDCTSTIVTNFSGSEMHAGEITGWLWGHCYFWYVDGTGYDSPCDDHSWHSLEPHEWDIVLEGPSTNTCGTVSSTWEGWKYYPSAEDPEFSYYKKETHTLNGGYADEYTTDDIISNAKACAYYASSSASFTPNEDAIAWFRLADDKSSVDIRQAKWRLSIIGAEKGKRYKVTIQTTTRIRADKDSKFIVTVDPPQEEKWTASDGLVQYFPDESGRDIKVEDGEACGYQYEKSVSVSIKPEDENDCGCDKTRTVASMDNSTLVRVNLGPGDSHADLGSLVVASAIATGDLSKRKSIAFVGDPVAPEVEFVSAIDGLAQVVTPRLFVNIASNSPTSMTLRVMTIGAQGSWNGSTYDWDNSGSYLVQQYAIENPDAGSATNRLRIREFGSSFTNEWMYTYTATNSGWNVNLPDGSGSIDLVATNHAANAYTLLKRHRDSTGAIIAQRSQIYTSFDWGYSLTEETAGLGADARTRTLAYYTGAPSNAPFTATTDRPPLQSDVQPDGSWRYIVQYTTDGLVQTELRGIDSGLTTNTNLCLRTEYTYTTQDAVNDTLSREPSQPRKIEEWWKGTLIRRTYHIYSSTYHKVIECPNPANTISDSSNLVSQTIYDADTMNVVERIHPDGTIERISWIGDTEQIDMGENDGMGYVANGTRTQTARSSIGTLTSMKSWDIVGGSVGVQTRDSVWSNFDYKERPQQLVEWGSGTSTGTTALTTTTSYDCCGLGSTTDPDGLVTSYMYDPLHRKIGVTRWGISTLNVLDSADRVILQWRIGTDTSSILQHGFTYDTAGFLMIQTNALAGTNTYIRSTGANGFDQILSGNPDGGTNLQTFLGDGRRDKLTGNSTAPIRYVYGLATGVSYLGGSRTFAYEQAIKLDATGADTSETEKTYFDGLGRTVIRELPGPAQYVTEYNNLGQKIRDIDPDGVWTLYRYDTKGDLIVTAIDVDHDQHVANYDAGYYGSDRVTQNIHYYVSGTDPGNPRAVDLRVDEQSVWTTASSAATALVTKTESITDGLKSWRSIYKDQTPTLVTTTIETVYGGGGSRTLTTTAASGVKQITTYSYGRPITLTEKDSANAQVPKPTFLTIHTAGVRKPLMRGTGQPRSLIITPIRS